MRPILLQGHTRSLTQIKYNYEGDLLFTVAKDQVVNVWYSHNGERLGTYHGHVGAIWTVDVNSTSSILLTGSADNTAKLWEVRTGKCLHTWEFKTAVKRVAFSEDDSMALLVTEQHMGYPGSVTIYSVKNDINAEQSDEPIKSIINQEGSKAMVAAWGYLNRYIITGHENGEISQYDWKTGDKIKSIHPHTSVITDLQMSEDRTYFITSSKDKSAQIFESNTLNPLKKYVTDAPLNSASIAPIQDFVILGGGQDAMIVTSTLMSQGKFECRFWHKILEEEVGRVKGHFGPINTIAVHPDGKSFSSGGEDGYVRVHHFDEDYFKFKYPEL